jgi:hypothetical protein
MRFWTVVVCIAVYLLSTPSVEAETATAPPSAESTEAQAPSPAPEVANPPAPAETVDPKISDIGKNLDDFRQEEGAPAPVQSVQAPSPLPDTAPLINAIIAPIMVLCVMIGLLLVVSALVNRARKSGGRGILGRLFRKVPSLAGPNYAELLAKFSLERGVTLYFVKSAGKVLVIGSAGQALSQLAIFDADDFDASEAAGKTPATQKNIDFRSVLEESARRMDGPQQSKDPLDIQGLRNELHVLQQRLKDAASDPSV